MRTPNLSAFMRSHGQDFELVRNAQVTSVVRGLPNTDDDGNYIGMNPETDVREGDTLRGKVSHQDHSIVVVKRSVVGERVWQVRAYYRLKEALPIVSNTITIGSMSNSAVQQASPGATVSIAVRQESVNDVETVLRSILSVIDQLGMDEKGKSEVRAEVDTIKAQLQLEKPKRFVISECLNGIKGIVHATVEKGGPAIGSWVVSQIEQVMHHWNP